MKNIPIWAPLLLLFCLASNASFAQNEENTLSLEARKLLGTWGTNITRSGQNVYVEWTFLDDGTAFNNQFDFAKWAYKNQILYISTETCPQMRGYAKFDLEVRMRFKVIENCNYSDAGAERIYAKTTIYGDPIEVNKPDQPISDGARHKPCHCCHGKGRYVCAACDGRKGQYFNEWNGQNYENRWHDCSICMGSGDSLCSCCAGIGKE